LAQNGECIKCYVKGCDKCQKVKARNIGPYGMMDSRPTLEAGRAVSCNLIGLLPKNPSGNIYALVIVDDYTRFLEIYPLRIASARAGVGKFIDYCCRYGWPESVRTDNGNQITSNLWNEVCDKLGIRARKIVAY
jgi:hypothetical protein